MAKEKKKLTLAQKRAKRAAKAERQKKYMWVFMNGKQVKVKRPETIDGMDIDEFIRRNADPIWLHQNEMWEYMDQGEDERAELEQTATDQAESQSREHAQSAGKFGAGRLVRK